MLSLRLEFLTGRYCASSPTNRNEAEWPPHPARVYSALVAAHHDGAASDPGRRTLQWLEAQEPPRLHFSPLSPDGLEVRDVFDTYVPVNDKALSDGATVQRAWAKVHAAANDKQRAAAEKKLKTAYEKAGGRQSKLAKSAQDELANVLPSTRTRQARTFPTVVPHDPVVWFAWDIEVPAEHLDALTQISRTVSRVGHSSSLVATAWSNTPPPTEPTWAPNPEGDQPLRWVSPGQLSALETLHTRDPYGEQRVMPYVSTLYAPVLAEPEHPRPRFSPHLLTFRRTKGSRLSVQHTELLAEAVRGALMRHAPDPVASVISGHHGDGSHSGEHLAIVGLPNVGQPYANGDLLGFALVLPTAADPADLAAVYSAIAGWEQQQQSKIWRGRHLEWEVEREVGLPKLSSLRSSTWTKASRRWVSATPVLLDRNPGALGSGSMEQQNRAHEKARASIEAACRRIGLPTPVAVELSRDPMLRGSAHAKLFRPPPRRRDHRPRVHVSVQFDEPVHGPILLGAGRHRGLGLMRPIPEGGEA